MAGFRSAKIDDTAGRLTAAAELGSERDESRRAGLVAASLRTAGMAFEVDESTAPRAGDDRAGMLRKAFEAFCLAGRFRPACRAEFESLAAAGVSTLPPGFAEKWRRKERTAAVSLPKAEVLEAARQRSPAFCLSNAPKSPVIDRGEVFVLAGPGGVGKSTLAACDLPLLAAGADLPNAPLIPFRQDGPDGRWESFEGSSLIVSWEETPRWVMERIEARRGPHEPRHEIHSLTIPRRDDLEPVDEPLFAAPGDDLRAAPDTTALFDDLAQAAKGMDDLALIVLDPFAELFAADANAPGPTRALLRACKELAADARAVVCLLAHSTKAWASNPFERSLIAGSGALSDGVRLALTMTLGRWPAEEDDDEDDGGLRTLGVLKASRAPSLQSATLAPVTGGSGAPCGFVCVGDWRQSTPAELRPKSSEDRKERRQKTAQERLELEKEKERRIAAERAERKRLLGP